MSLPKPEDLLKEADSYYREELIRGLMRHGFLSPGGERDLVVVSQGGDLSYIRDSAYFHKAERSAGSGRSLGFVVIADFGRTCITLTEYLSKEAAQEVVDYILKCIGNCKCDIRVFLKERGY